MTDERRPLRIATLAPELTARRTLTGGQALALAQIVVVMVILFLLAPLAVATGLVAVLTVVYAAVVGYRLVALLSALRNPDVVRIDDDEALAIPDEDLPVYTVLVPAYHEPEVIGVLIERLSRLAYPATKLDVRLLLEEDDPDTIAAAERALRRGDRAARFEIVRVPASEPRTKPKACNVGLAGALGDLVTVYDAEDRPDPLQLRRAVAAFARLDPSVACLQAKLAYYNADQNLLTRWFAIEYSMWFSGLLPGLVSHHAPLPLGGTSNHFRREVLAEVGGWDAYNVTEDADLGIRLHRLGYRTQVLESTTYEEANSDPINWVKQRSRWYKGYLQTWLVHVRRPARLWRELGPRGFLGFTLFVAGTPLLALLNPIVWSITALWFMVHPAVIAALFPGWLYYPSLALMVGANAALYYSWVVSARIAGPARLTVAALVVPFYWLLMALAAIKAALQLVTAPSFWEKTVHGLDNLTEPLEAPTVEAEA